MIAIFLMWWTFALVAARPRSEEGQKDYGDSGYTLILGTLPLAYAATGFLGLVLTQLSLLHYSITDISAAIAGATTIFRRRSLGALRQSTRVSIDDLHNIINGQCGNKGLWRTIGLICILIVAVSIGPINQPDAIDYHVGYPKQFLLHGGNLRDGGLHQGLIGLGDFANLAFIQEHTDWLIRSAQALALIPLVLLLSRHGTRPSFLVAFLIAPVFIGWVSVGKPMLLGDSCIAATYLCWKIKPTWERSAFVLIAIISGISFKVSAILISAPIAIDMCCHLYTSKQGHRGRICQGNLHWLIALSAVMLISLFAYRYEITGNPLYPLASHLFTPHNQQAIGFEEYLRNFSRDSFLFPLSLFMPTSLGLLASTLGPCIGLVCIYQCIQMPSADQQSRQIHYVALGQALLLLLFGQGRADYYAAPIILLLSNVSPGNPKHVISEKYLFLKPGFQGLLIGQALLFILMATTSIYQTFIAATSPQLALRQWAYGYDATQQLERFEPPHLNLAFRTPRLFYKDGYIDQDRFLLCLSEQANLANSYPHAVSQCMRLLGAKSVMTTSGALKSAEEFSCTSTKATLGQRNPFNNKKVDVDICTQS
jgi:hypothetical protein